MKKNLMHVSLLLSILFVSIFVLFPTKTVSATPTCTYSDCNWVDPEGTTCWSDAYVANWAYGTDGIMKNKNMYSPGCYANWSRTENTTATYLGAETVGVYRYDGTQAYLYVWNNMWDGGSLVCTRGYKGPSYQNYNVSSNGVCA